MSLSSNPPSETLRGRNGTVNITGSSVDLRQSMYLMQEYQGVMQASSCMNREESAAVIMRLVKPQWQSEDDYVIIN